MPFNSPIVELIDSNITLHFFHIDKITSELEKVIDNTIVTICRWPKFSTSVVKQKNILKKLLELKQWTTLELGHISEFFIHLYLNYHWFHQECLYQNLEEAWIKKWFDGYYTYNNKEWIIESKSWTMKADITHKSKTHDAYIDIWKKVSWENLNADWYPISPWFNAYNHATTACSNETLLNNLNKLSEEFDEWKFYNISEFNIITVSTIFKNWKTVFTPWIEDYSKIKDEISTWLVWKNIKEWHIICTTQSTKDILINYLNSIC